MNEANDALPRYEETKHGHHAQKEQGRDDQAVSQRQFNRFRYLAGPLASGRIGDHGQQHLVEAKRNHGRQAGKAKEQEGVTKVGVEDIVHLTDIFRVPLARFGEAKRILKVANHAVARFLEHHDEHRNENQIELFLRDQFQPEKPDGGVGGLALEDGQRPAVRPQLALDEGEGKNGMNAQKQQRESDRPSD